MNRVNHPGEGVEGIAKWGEGRGAKKKKAKTKRRKGVRLGKKKGGGKMKITKKAFRTRVQRGKLKTDRKFGGGLGENLGR